LAKLPVVDVEEDPLHRPQFATDVENRMHPVFKPDVRAIGHAQPEIAPGIHRLFANDLADIGENG
jgi:hypothetical protein